MKTISCSYENCNQRRLHYTLQDQNRPRQMIEVDDDFEGDCYCSLTCMMLDGKMSVRQHKKEDCVSYQEGSLPCEDCEESK